LNSYNLLISKDGINYSLVILAPSTETANLYFTQKLQPQGYSCSSVTLISSDPLAVIVTSFQVETLDE
jgi:hypothetical protein